MKKIIPILLAIIIAFFLVVVIDPISHPKDMLGRWDTDTQAAYVLKPFGICTAKGTPGRWFVKDGKVYLSTLFVYEDAEIVDETQWIMHGGVIYDVGHETRIWTKIE